MTRPLSTVLLAAMLLASGRLAAGAAERVDTAAASTRIRAGEIRRLLDQVVAAGAPGVAVRVVDGRRVTQTASGVADQESGRRMRPGLNYRIGSITKSYVATLVLQLVAEGRLSLDDTLERWLPGTLPYGDQVTIRQLLNHTSGIPEYVYGPIAQVYTNPERSWAPAELVALVAGQPQTFAAGTAWSYSNTDYVLAGMIIETITGNGLDQELRRRIFRPLRLRDSSFPVDGQTIPGPHASGHSLPLGQQQGPLLDISVFNPSLAWATGALVSDLREVERFFRALLRGQLIPPPLVAEMTTPFPTGRGFGYGLGLIVMETPAGRVVGHDGAIPGFRDIVLSTVDGRRQVGIVMNVYFDPPAASEAFTRVFTELQTRVFGGATSDAALRAAARTGTPTPALPAADENRCDQVAR